MREGLSKRQQEVYEFIKRYIRDHGFPPSVREIGEAVELLSTSTVHAHLNTLEKKGMIRRLAAKNRCIEITEQNFYNQKREMLHIPILGKVAAGEPIFAEENVEDTFPMPLEYFDSNNDYFMLRIQGDSMINVGICNRDLIIIKKQSTARNGDIVVALVEDSATVKTFYREKNHIRLQPENDNYDPIILKEAEVLGVLVGLFRTYR